MDEEAPGAMPGEGEEPRKILAITQLGSLWQRSRAARCGGPSGSKEDFLLDRRCLDLLGVPLEAAMRFLYVESSTADDFARWLEATSCGLTPARCQEIEATLQGGLAPEAQRRRSEEVRQHPNVLRPEELERWRKDGYLVVEQAVDPHACAALAGALWEYVRGNPQDPESWYRSGQPGIMVPLFDHAAQQELRGSMRLHKIFAQLWETDDLQASCDRMSFHPPQRPSHPFSGPDLHWDVDLLAPVPFGVQGLVYLTDTAPEQGALTLVPGFHQRLAGWLEALPPGADAQAEDLHALGSLALGGRAGALVVWHQALPHGSRPNLGSRPRMVQYLTMRPNARTS